VQNSASMAALFFATLTDGLLDVVKDMKHVVTGSVDAVVGAVARNVTGCDKAYSSNTLRHAAVGKWNSVIYNDFRRKVL
jgi:hypothetical protein